METTHALNFVQDYNPTGKPGPWTAYCETCDVTWVLRKAPKSSRAATLILRAHAKKYRSWKAEVIADSSGEFCGNALRFATKKEAQVYAANLASRWSLVSQWRVVASEDPVTEKGN